MAHGENLVFKNGQQLHVKRVVARTTEFISVELQNGVVRYPLNTLVSIDGQPVGEPAAEAAPAAGSASASAPVEGFSAAANSTPTFGTTEVAEATPAAATNGAPTPAASEANPASVPVLPRAKTAVPEAGDRWNFEVFLVGYLVLLGVWMRGLQAVQRDLHERRVEPRYWTMAALLLPGIGAGAYFATQWARQRLAEARAHKWKSEPEPEPEAAPEEAEEAPEPQAAAPADDEQ